MSDESVTSTYDIATSGTRYLDLAGGESSFKILLEESNFGGRELELAEHTFAPGTESHVLSPGMVGVVRPGDQVVHRVPSSDTPAHVLIIWTPAGEIDRIFRNAGQKTIPKVESRKQD